MKILREKKHHTTLTKGPSWISKYDVMRSRTSPNLYMPGQVALQPLSATHAPFAARRPQKPGRHGDAMIVEPRAAAVMEQLK